MNPDFFVPFIWLKSEISGFLKVFKVYFCLESDMSCCVAFRCWTLATASPFQTSSRRRRRRRGCGGSSCRREPWRAPCPALAPPPWTGWRSSCRCVKVCGTGVSWLSKVLQIHMMLVLGPFGMTMNELVTWFVLLFSSYRNGGDWSETNLPLNLSSAFNQDIITSPLLLWNNYNDWLVVMVGLRVWGRQKKKLLSWCDKSISNLNIDRFSQ